MARDREPAKKGFRRIKKSQQQRLNDMHEKEIMKFNTGWSFVSVRMTRRKLRSIQNRIHTTTAFLKAKKTFFFFIYHRELFFYGCFRSVGFFLLMYLHFTTTADFSLSFFCGYPCDKRKNWQTRNRSTKQRAQHARMAPYSISDSKITTKSVCLRNTLLIMKTALGFVHFSFCFNQN